MEKEEGQRKKSTKQSLKQNQNPHKSRKMEVLFTDNLRLIKDITNLCVQLEKSDDIINL